MAKKKKVTVSKPASESIDDGRVRLAFRFDNHVAEGLQVLSEKTGISVNQLMNAMGQWMIKNGHPGMEPVKGDDERNVLERQQEGVIWFGRCSTRSDVYATEEDVRNSHGAIEMGDSTSVSDNNGVIFGVLDFTVRRVVRDE